MFRQLDTIISTVNIPKQIKNVNKTGGEEDLLLGFVGGAVMNVM